MAPIRSARVTRHPALLIFQPSSQGVFPAAFDQAAADGQTFLQSPPVPQTVRVFLQVVEQFVPGLNGPQVGRAGLLDMLDEPGSDHFDQFDHSLADPPSQSSQPQNSSLFI